MSQKILISGGRLIDPKNNIDELLDILISEGKVEKIGKNLSANLPLDKGRSRGILKIDAKNKVVCPGLIDLQVHFREPGREDKETLETGMKAALAGGVTGVVTMPNTNPVPDNQAPIEFQLRRAEKLNLINIYPTGSITVGEKGERISEMRELKLAGAIAVTDDGVDVQSAGLLEKGMEWARTFEMLLMSHCEEESLHGKSGVMHEGEWSTKMGLAGISPEVEDLGLYRNLLLAEKTGVRFHALHCSTKRSIELLREFKKRNPNITCETCPQYFSLDDSIAENYNTFAKMYPPIRSEEHRLAMIEGLKEDVIDAISTDHAPHLLSEKMYSFADAPPGSVGVETSFALGITNLVHAGHLSLSKLIEKMSTNPAKIIRVDRGHLSEGAVADVAIFDPNEEWTVDPQKFYSKGKNSVFRGIKVKGKVSEVLVEGQVKVEKGEVL